MRIEVPAVLVNEPEFVRLPEKVTTPLVFFCSMVPPVPDTLLPTVKVQVRSKTSAPVFATAPMPREPVDVLFPTWSVPAVIVVAP